MSGKKLHVAFLWHMHQPLYKDYLTGKYLLPWVRMHATYSYLDMISILEHFPRIKCTFNFTPSLIWQLADISKGGRIDDVYLELSSKNAGYLTLDEKCFLLRNFFSCASLKTVFQLKKYQELYFRRGEKFREEDLPEKSDSFDESDFRDLQVFFNLSWCGYTLRESDPLIRYLFAKGARFTETEKKDLLMCQMEVVSSILPRYKKMQDDGKIEISTTPFYHPILPLLCGSSNDEGFDYREDAAFQVKKAVELYKEAFGRKPLGMWPAEGAVSHESVRLMAAAGIRWTATDESILFKSLKAKKIVRDDYVFSPFFARYGLRSVGMVFRDTGLSNAISFRYANMTGEDAAHDLMKDIVGIKNAVESRSGDHIVSVILDGENPWPHYPSGGRDFLGVLYRMLSARRDVETVSLGSFLAGCSGAKRIARLETGSWVNGDLKKWIGSPQKNKAWEYLGFVREELLTGGRKPSREALEELYAAEASDWFWWYDEFGSELNYVFDDLFRLHLKNVYRVEKREAPSFLDEPVCGSRTGLIGIPPEGKGGVMA